MGYIWLIYGLYMGYSKDPGEPALVYPLIFIGDVVQIERSQVLVVDGHLSRIISFIGPCLL